MRRKDILTPKEKIALYYMTKRPFATDKEIAKLTKLKLSTVTAIRRRLMNMGIFRDVSIALLPNLGAELLTVSYGTLNRLLKGVDEKVYKETAKNIFYHLTDGLSDVAIGYEMNYTGALKNAERLKSAIHGAGLSIENWHTIFFPVTTTYVLNFFDFSPVLRLMFNLDLPASEKKIEPQPLFSVKEVVELTKKERIGFAGFLAVPGGTDVNVSEKTKLSRQAVSSMRKRFVGKIFQPARDIEIAKLGCEVVALTHDKFNIGLDVEKKVKVLSGALADLPLFFGVASNSDGIYLSVHTSYKEYVESHRRRLEKIAKEEPKMIENTTSVLYSVSHLSKVRDYAFLDVATEFLGLPKL